MAYASCQSFGLKNGLCVSRFDNGSLTTEEQMGYVTQIFGKLIFIKETFKTVFNNRASTQK